MQGDIVMKQKFTKWAKKAFGKLAVGQVLMKEYCDGEPRYFIQGQGTEITSRTAMELINGKALTPVTDGLFEGESQCYEKTRERLEADAAG